MEGNVERLECVRENMLNKKGNIGEALQHDGRVALSSSVGYSIYLLLI